MDSRGTIGLLFDLARFLDIFLISSLHVLLTAVEEEDEASPIFFSLIEKIRNNNNFIIIHFFNTSSTSIVTATNRFIRVCFEGLREFMLTCVLKRPVGDSWE